MHAGATAQLSSILDLVYDAPFREGAWRPALTAIADFVRADASDLNFFEPQFFTYRRWEHARIDADTIGRYANAFMSDMRNVHPRVPVVARLRSGQMVADSELWSRAERERMPYFVDVFQRAGLRDGITACVNAGSTGNGGSDLIVLGTYYAKPIKALSDCRRRIDALLPHLRRACAVEARLLQARRETAVLTDVLNRVSDAVVMLDRDGRLPFANASAATLLEANTGVGLTPDRRLWLSGVEARTRLAQALTRCAGSLLWLPGEAKPAAPVVVHRTNAQPIVLTLQALPRDLAGAYGAVALAFISHPSTRKTDRCTALRAVYGLTLSESQLAQAISDGMPLRLYAESHDISYETARTYLRRVFDKTGTRRQAELAGVVRALR